MEWKENFFLPISFNLLINHHLIDNLFFCFVLFWISLHYSTSHSIDDWIESPDAETSNTYGKRITKKNIGIFVVRIECVFEFTIYWSFYNWADVFLSHSTFLFLKKLLLLDHLVKISFVAYFSCFFSVGYVSSHNNDSSSSSGNSNR